MIAPSRPRFSTAAALLVFWWPWSGNGIAVVEVDCGPGCIAEDIMIADTGCCCNVDQMTVRVVGDRGAGRDVLMDVPVAEA